MTAQREQLEADVLIVGAGPAGLACALDLANLIKKHNESGASGGPPLSAENIYVLLHKGFLVSVSGNPAPVQKQRQLRHLPEPAGEMARRTGRKIRRESVYPIWRRATYL
jgi:electron-transferring-flavoprotein dehydrogenase